MGNETSKYLKKHRLRLKVVIITYNLINPKL